MLTEIDSKDLERLIRELRAMDKEFGNAVRTELREPLRRMTSDLKFSARTQLPSFVGSDAASGIRYSTSFKGYRVVREKNDRFTQHGYTDAHGKVRHPLYGNRNYWYDTEITGRGWWTGMVEKTLPRAVDEFTVAVLAVVNRLQTGVFATKKVGRGVRLDELRRF